MPTPTEISQDESGSPPLPSTSVQLPSTSDRSNAPPVLSKSAQKKAIKAERIAALKPERRAREKEAKKLKRQRLTEEKRAAATDPDSESLTNTRRKKPRVGENSFGARVIIDLGFDDKMSDKEITSLCSQLAYTYSANRRASYPFRLLYTSLNGRTMSRLESMNEGGYKRWTNTEWWQEGYDRLWTSPNPNHDSEAGLESLKGTVVYLTADSDEELTELREKETYIIGGLCDHNRYKSLCLSKAVASGVRSARLPIGRYIASLPTRKVLTVNQVFEILVHWVQVRDWEHAFHAVIPKRKFQAGGKAGQGEDHIEVEKAENQEPLVADDTELGGELVTIIDADSK